MIQGICVDPGATVSLEKGKKYFLFPNGKDHYYVSKLPNQKAHKGCFQAILFKPVKEEEWPEEPKGPTLIRDFDPEKIYKATLIWRKPGSTAKIKDYYLRLNSNHLPYKVKLISSCYVYERFENGDYAGFAGSLPLHWFSNITEVQPEELIHNDEQQEFQLDTEPTLEEIALEYTVCEQLTLF